MWITPPDTHKKPGILLTRFFTEIHHKENDKAEPSLAKQLTCFYISRSVITKHIIRIYMFHNSILMGFCTSTTCILVAQQALRLSSKVWCHSAQAVSSHDHAAAACRQLPEPLVSELEAEGVAEQGLGRGRARRRPGAGQLEAGKIVASLGAVVTWTLPSFYPLLGPTWACASKSWHRSKLTQWVRGLLPHPCKARDKNPPYFF